MITAGLDGHQFLNATRYQIPSVPAATDYYIIVSGNGVTPSGLYEACQHQVYTSSLDFLHQGNWSLEVSMTKLD